MNETCKFAWDNQAVIPELSKKTRDDGREYAYAFCRKRSGISLGPLCRGDLGVTIKCRRILGGERTGSIHTHIPGADMNFTPADYLNALYYDDTHCLIDPETEQMFCEDISGVAPPELIAELDALQRFGDHAVELLDPDLFDDFELKLEQIRTDMYNRGMIENCKEPRQKVIIVGDGTPRIVSIEEATAVMKESIETKTVAPELIVNEIPLPPKGKRPKHFWESPKFFGKQGKSKGPAGKVTLRRP